MGALLKAELGRCPTAVAAAHLATPPATLGLMHTYNKAATVPCAIEYSQCDRTRTRDTPTPTGHASLLRLPLLTLHVNPSLQPIISISSSNTPGYSDCTACPSSAALVLAPSPPSSAPPSTRPAAPHRPRPPHEPSAPPAPPPRADAWPRHASSVPPPAAPQSSQPHPPPAGPSRGDRPAPHPATTPRPSQ
jgi:hypothetical protein